MKIFHGVNVGYLGTAQRDWLPRRASMATAVQPTRASAPRVSVGLAQAVVGLSSEAHLQVSSVIVAMVLCHSAECMASAKARERIRSACTRAPVVSSRPCSRMGVHESEHDR